MYQEFKPYFLLIPRSKKVMVQLHNCLIQQEIPHLTNHFPGGFGQVLIPEENKNEFNLLSVLFNLELNFDVPFLKSLKEFEMVLVQKEYSVIS